MQNLFNITEDFTVELNKEWILLIPAFTAILRADKGSPSDSEGRKKLKARKQLGYVYFMRDFRSPIYGYEEAQRHEEALRYVGMDPAEAELDIIQNAMREYEQLQLGQARSLKTLNSAYKGMNALDNYLENVDFEATDKQGKLLHSPKEFVSNLQNLNKAYDEIAKFEKRVYEELKDSTTIRGTATLGDKERTKETRSTEWEEGTADNTNVPAFTDISVHINKTKQSSTGTSTNEDEGCILEQLRAAGKTCGTAPFREIVKCASG